MLYSLPMLAFGGWLICVAASVPGMSSDCTERRATPLGEAIAARIRRSGPISVAEYMTLCLHDPEHGYYRRRAGVGRDFVTAPEISQMFGELSGCGARSLAADG